jgi:hypothetical protein
VKKDLGTYYLGRIIKKYKFDQDKLIEDILFPKPYLQKHHSWTIIDSKKFELSDGSFLYGRLSKYKPDAEVKIIDPMKREELNQQEPNLSIASSPFVYLPNYSGIAFLRVPQKIEPYNFLKVFPFIIQSAHNALFPQCEIEAISDLQSFAIKLSKLEGISEISATVKPPNPLFGPLWSSLKKYLEERQTDKMNIQEVAGNNHFINTILPTHVKKAADQTKEKKYEPDPLPIGDAAVLMAADGYGSGYVKGTQNGEFRTIKTSETIKNFNFLKLPDPKLLYKKARQLFIKIQEDRHMEH